MDQYAEKSAQPTFESPTAQQRWWDAEGDIGSGPYQYVTGGGENGDTSHHEAPVKPTAAHIQEKNPQSGTIDITVESQLVLRHPDTSAGDMDAVPPVAATRVHAAGGGADYHPASETHETQNSNARLPMMYSRTPPTSPVLRPEYRYCQRDGFVKPLRAHHCRACGTVSTTLIDMLSD